MWSFWDKVRKIYCILFETSCEIFTPFYRTRTGAFVTRLIATFKSGWRIYLWPRITVRLPRGSPRRRLERGVALNIGCKLYFTLWTAFLKRGPAPPWTFFSPFSSWPAYLFLHYLSIQESWLTFFINNSANGPWPQFEITHIQPLCPAGCVCFPFVFCVSLFRQFNMLLQRYETVWPYAHTHTHTHTHTLAPILLTVGLLHPPHWLLNQPTPSKHTDIKCSLGLLISRFVLGLSGWHC